MFQLIAIDISQKSPHFSLLSPTSPCELSEREVTSPSNLKVVGALDNYSLVFVILLFFSDQYFFQLVVRRDKLKNMLMQKGLSNLFSGLSCGNGLNNSSKSLLNLLPLKIHILLIPSVYYFVPTFYQILFILSLIYVRLQLFIRFYSFYP